jgi:RHS repeat-associated protein
MNYKYGGFIQMSNEGREDGSNVPHERLAQEVVAEEAGYFYIYLSNESDTGSEAFFDDFSIQVSESFIVQQIDYYPYGMVAREFRRLGDKATNDLFQGKTYEDLTKWYDFHARQYDASLGRWFGVDPQDQFASPYLAMGNNPVMMVDPDGEFVVPMLFGAAISVFTNGINNISSGQGFFKGAGKAALIGGIGGALSFGIGEIAQTLNGISRFGFQTLAHGTLGGGMSAADGGSFGSGFLSGSLSSMMSTGSAGLMGNSKSALAKGLVTVGTGALSGGIGSSIAGGNFWAGVRNGAISSTLNHGIHSGVFGENVMMAAISGRLRHLFGPDAISYGATMDIAYGGVIAGELGILEILRGAESGKYLMKDIGAGAMSDIQFSAGVETSRYYYSGPEGSLKASVFSGARIEANLNLTVLPSVSAGRTVSFAWANDRRNWVAGFGNTASAGVSAFDAVFLPLNGGINKGETFLERLEPLSWRRK